MDTYEKKYKETLERAKKLYENANGMILKKWVEQVFPELKESEESENEKVRKALIQLFQSDNEESFGEFTNKQFVAWLEKQKDCIKLSDSAYTSNKDVIKFADKYSHAVWEKLMYKFKKIENYSIGCNDVSDIVLNAIINTYNWLGKQHEQKSVISDDALREGIAHFGITQYQIDNWLKKYIDVEKQDENNKWKPSKDEMDALYGLAYITNIMDDKKDAAITKLYQDLKREFFNGVSYENMFPSSPVDASIKSENQGEHKPIDKVEPKFGVGDWVTDNYRNLFQIVKIDNGWYYADDGDRVCFDVAHDYYHKWTIADAKNGDILHSTGFHSDCFFIFNCLDNWKFDEPNGDKAVATAHCCITISADNLEFSIQGPDCIEVNRIKPATKEQCELLFQKMEEAGYEWDAEKKELSCFMA